MNAIKLAVGILFVVLAATTCTLARAQDGGRPSEANVGPADSPEHSVFLPFAQGADASRIGPDDRVPPASSVTVPVSDSVASVPDPDQQRSAAPSTTKSQDDGFDGCCRFFCNDPCPCFYGEVEALFMQRDPGFARQPIVVDPNTHTTYLSTSDLNFNFDPALRATVGMRLCGGLALEFSYFGLLAGNASAGAVSPGPGAFLSFPGNSSGNAFVDMSGVQVNYSSWVNSFEVNLPCCCGCCGCCDECRDECGCGECRGGCGCGEVYRQSVEWFGGFRYLNLGEELNISTQRVVTGGVEAGAYNIGTANNLYGAQLGARLRRTKGRFGWEVTGKAGIFVNDAQETQSVTDFPNYALRPTVSSSGDEVAFVGEINLSALYGLTDVWNLRVGYNVMWIDGLALAPDQLDFNFASAFGGGQLHNGGGMFLQGVNIGLEASW